MSYMSYFQRRTTSAPATSRVGREAIRERRRGALAQRSVLSLLIVVGLLCVLPGGYAGAQTSGRVTAPGADATSKGEGVSPQTCIIAFGDVQPTDYFYDGVRFLYCMGAVTGYGDGLFRPSGPTTRGQISKVLAVAEGWALNNPPSATFEDVPPGSTFYTYVETAYAHGIVHGYADGYFRPNEPVTRGQLTKMVVLSEGWPLSNPPSPTFGDVQPGSTFFTYIETGAGRGIIRGYQDGTFKPNSSTTRGQVAKMVYYARTNVMTPQEQETIRLINERRAALGLGTLRTDAALSRAGRRHSSDIGPAALCQHNGTDGTSPWDRAAQAGYTGFAMGEVVGCNYATPLGVVDGWWASPGHHAVLVDPAAQAIGCGWWVNGSGYGWQTCVTGQP